MGGNGCTMLSFFDSVGFGKEILAKIGYAQPKNLGFEHGGRKLWGGGRKEGGDSVMYGSVPLP